MQKTSFFSHLISFFITLVPTYIVVITAEWSLVQAYTYFKGDSLKTIVGDNWVMLFYTIPLIIAICIATVRIVILRRNIKIEEETEIIHRPSISVLGRKKYFDYKGLLWEPRHFSFQNPIPVCPTEGCHRPIDCFRINPPQYLISSNLTEMQEFLDKQNTYKYVYKCPLHGEI